MMRELEATLQEVCRSLWDARTMHIPCLAHVVQLCVNAFLNSIKATSTINASKDTFDEAEITAATGMDKGFRRTLTLVSMVTHSDYKHQNIVQISEIKLITPLRFGPLQKPFEIVQRN